MALVALKCVEGFGLGVPINGAEDPVIPAILRHDVLLKFGTARCLSKTPGEVAGDGKASDSDGDL